MKLFINNAAISGHNCGRNQPIKLDWLPDSTYNTMIKLKSDHGNLISCPGY